MSPYEFSEPGGSVEHWNEEAGFVWMRRLAAHWTRVVWIIRCRTRRGAGRSPSA